MFNNLRMDQVFIACGPTDLRKSVDGLAAIVQASFQLDPFSSHLFVFCNRKKDKLKILHWDHNGFWLFYRRLEKGVFDWPQDTASPLNITRYYVFKNISVRRGYSLILLKVPEPVPLFIVWSKQPKKTDSIR